MSIYSALKGNGPSGFGFGSSAERVTVGLDLTGRNILLTGCTAGIGAETLRVLEMRGAHVIACARTEDKARAAAADVGAENVTPVACELSDPASVRACVDAVAGMGKPLHAIICNAGIMALPKLHQACGLELQFMTNHVGHFMLVTGVLDRLADDGRVVMVSSSAHRRAPKEGIQFDNLSGEDGYRPFLAYGQSKLANLLFARHLATRLPQKAQTANAVHPGVIRTKLVRHMNPVARVGMSIVSPIALKSAAQGAATQVFVATHPSVAETSGEFFADCNVAPTTKNGRDLEMAARLWQVTEEIVAGL